MAFSFNLTAPFRFSFNASKGHLSMFWGRSERGFVLETGHGSNPGLLRVETWRNPLCGSFNAAALGLHLVVASPAAAR